MKFEIKQEDNRVVVKCIRFPKDLVEQIKEEADKNKVTFSKFVLEACKFALDNMVTIYSQKIRDK